MIKKLSTYFLIFICLLSTSPLLARPAGRFDAGRRDVGRDVGHRDFDRRDLNGYWDRGDWSRGYWGNNGWYNQGYYPDYYNDIDYIGDPSPTTNYPVTTSAYTNNYVGSFAITSSGPQNGVYIVYIANGMAFQMSYPGFDPVGSFVDVYSLGDLTFSLVINGQSYMATRIK